MQEDEATKPAVHIKKPVDISQAEMNSFIALVLQGGEVDPAVLPRRAQEANLLCFAKMNGAIIATAGLKVPSDRYREKVFRRSEYHPVEQFEFNNELGWIYTHPDFRQRGIAASLVKEISHHISTPTFATSRSDNIPMHTILRKSGFVSVGSPYRSQLGDASLMLFVHNSFTK